MWHLCGTCVVLVWYLCGLVWYLCGLVWYVCGTCVVLVWYLCGLVWYMCLTSDLTHLAQQRAGPLRVYSEGGLPCYSDSLIVVGQGGPGWVEVHLLIAPI